MKQLLLFIFLLSCVHSNGQISNKMKKLVGIWEYKKGSGFETWKVENDMVVGYEYRVNKIGDTLKVEEMHIKLVGKNLIYSIGEHHNLSDSTMHHESLNFLGGKRKMSFVNIDSNTPYSISYSFGLFSKNRLKIRIQYGQTDKPAKLNLIRIDD